MKKAGLVIWLTGLSGAGKSTISGHLRSRLAEQGVAAVQLDGDEVRSGIGRDLGFSDEDRNENIRRVAEIARLLCEQGFVIVCSLISPLISQREMARSIIGDRFFEVHVDCSLDEVKRRDTKGLYAKAARGEIKLFTGISSPYEAPDSPELHLDTFQLTEEECADLLLGQINERL